MKYKSGGTGKVQAHITRESVFQHMWMNIELTDFHKAYIHEKYPELFQIHSCIREFRNIFENRNVSFLYLFIEKYRNEEIKLLKSFAKGLGHDIDAVENAVSYDYSNGLVEGTNSRDRLVE